MTTITWSVDPVALHLGAIRIYWYGILFATAILSGLQYMKWVFKQEGKDEALLDPMFLYIVIGIVVGARLGHCLFYDPAFYLSHPMKIFAVWEGGLASHGGGAGVLLSLYLYVKKYKMNYLWLLDRVAIPTALFGFFVRMGNLMNSEIVGVPVEHFSFGVIFTRVDGLVRHPVQVYEALAYLGIFITLTLLYKIARDKITNGTILGLFLVSVFSARFLLEFIKTKQEAYSDVVLSTGQWLSIPFLVIGLYLIVRSITSKQGIKSPKE